MGKDPDPWQFSNLGFDMQQKNSCSRVFPAFTDPYGFSFPRLFQPNPALIPSLNRSSQKRFLVFDQSGDQTSLIFSSLGTQFPTPNPTDRGLDFLGSIETFASDGNGNEIEEMHEDTEEIDALLYSDSDNDYEEEEASTGHSPIETTTVRTKEEQEVASSLLPAKRRRVESELDPSLADTASSTHCGGDHEAKKKLKRERIQETVGVLRRIIPGGKRKDASGVLDEAIRYLRALRLKAKGLGVAPL